MAPLISVVLAVHNGAPYIRESLISVLAQDYPDFEVVAINDGSTDATAAILDAIAEADPRLRVLHRPKSGLGASLNAGCAAARGTLLARMDADDICLTGRLSKQAGFLASNPGIAICGTFLRTFGTLPRRTIRQPTQDPGIRAELLFSCPIMHPTVMLRREVLETLGGYDPTIRYGEDYDLWVRAMDRYSFANLAEPLLRYRRHAGQMGSRHAQTEQTLSRMCSMGKALAHLGLFPNADELALHHTISLGPCLGLSIPAGPDFLERAEGWLAAILAANAAKGFLPEPRLTEVIGRYWYFACFGAMIHDYRAFATYRHSPLSRLVRPDILSRAAIALGGYARLCKQARIAALAIDAFGRSSFGGQNSKGNR